jgi:hypothetical protein
MENLVGKRFGRLKVIGFSHKDKRGKPYWICQCDCGNTTVSRADSLKSGKANSCGCLSAERIVRANTVHGRCSNGKKNGDATYRSWHSMKQRCCDPNADQYPLYGKRGIKVCNRWLHSFENFVADMGERPVGTTIDRIDSNGNYEPGNCRWATAEEQNNNTRSNHFILFRGKTKTLAQWSHEVGISESTVSSRIGRGWKNDRLFA